MSSALPELRRPLILVSVMAAMAMIAIEATIVSTAMPQIAGQLGDLHLYAWVFSSFLLTQTATTVVFGKLADLYGRKPVLLVGIAIFLIGSILCGFAWSMPSLILFRLIQGVGAGAIQPVGLTVIGDLYSVQERGKIQGYLASVWGISSVVGPFAGGLIIQHMSWAWIFWINIPIGIAAAIGFITFLHEGVEKEQRSVDIAGAVLFTVAVSSLMIALTELGAGADTTAIIAACISAVATVLFILQERRARDPMMALSLWSRRAIATANAATLLSGMAIIGLTTFLPMYVQGVLNQSPLIAGLTLTVMVLGWPVGATIAAKNFNRFGLRPTLLFGATLLPLGALFFLTARSRLVAQDRRPRLDHHGPRHGLPQHRCHRDHPGQRRLGRAGCRDRLEHLLAQSRQRTRCDRPRRDLQRHPDHGRRRCRAGRDRSDPAIA